MESITTEEIQAKIDLMAQLALFWHTDEGRVTKSLDYNFQTGEYIIQTSRGSETTKDMLTATRLYNAE